MFKHRRSTHNRSNTSPGLFTREGFSVRPILSSRRRLLPYGLFRATILAPPPGWGNAVNRLAVAGLDTG